MNFFKNIKDYFFKTQENEKEELIDVRDELFNMKTQYLENTINTYNNFLNGGLDNYSNGSGGDRELYSVYDQMDNGDGSAVLDIYATSTIVNSSTQMFRPYTVIIKNRNNSKKQSKEFEDYIKFNEEESEIFKMLHGFVRDGYKYGIAYEKMQFDKCELFRGRKYISGFESLPTDEMYPLHGDDKTKTTEYLRKYYKYDYYHRSNHLKNVKKTNTEEISVIYNKDLILTFKNSERTFNYVGKSIFFPAMESWISMKISEAKLLVQRITRSAQKIIHSIDTDGKTTGRIKEEKALLQQFNKNNKVVAELNTKFIQQQKNITPDSDIITFTNNGKGGSSVVSSDGDIKSITDIDHWRHIFLTSVHALQSYILDSSLKNASRDAVTEADKMFEGIISNGRTKLENPLKKFYNTIIDNYYNKEGACKNFEIEFRWTPISNIEELRREKTLQIRTMIAKTMRLDLDIPDEYIYRKVYKMSDNDIKEINKLPKPNPLALQIKRKDDLGQNTTSPKTTPKVKAPKESLNEMIKEMVEFVNINSPIFESEELENCIKLIEEIMENSIRY